MLRRSELQRTLAENERFIEMKKRLTACIMAFLMAVTFSITYAKGVSYGKTSCDLRNYTPSAHLKSITYGSDYRSQLTEYEQQIYDVRQKNIESMKAGKVEYIQLPVQGNIPTSDFKILAYAAFNAAYAFEYDHPEHFWLSKYITVGYASSGGIIDAFFFVKPEKGWWCSPYASYDEVVSAQKQLEETAQKIANTALQNGRYKAVKYLHDYIAENNEYNRHVISGETFETLPELAWCAASALLPHTDSRYDPVCEGYAKAFKVLCDYADIPCALVSGDAYGGAHMWNTVKMHNGLWFHVDVTFDDSGILTYDYFLKGSSTMNRSHVLDGCVAGFGTLIYPIICTRDYPQTIGDSLGDANLDGKLNTGDAIAILKHVTEIIELSSQAKKCSDFNCDGDISTGDCVSLLRFLTN